jgi:hypothetical protein
MRYATESHGPAAIWKRTADNSRGEAEFGKPKQSKGNVLIRRDMAERCVDVNGGGKAWS